MALNINKKNYRLADMSMSPEKYPDPDESAEIIRDSIDMAEFGTVLHVREWQSDDKTVEQYALMLNVTPAHSAYGRCKMLKGSLENFEQVRRTDTWHSAVHSHQYFIDCGDCEKEIHNELYGGEEEENSRRVVQATFKKYYNKILKDPFDYLDRWEAGKNP